MNQRHFLLVLLHLAQIAHRLTPAQAVKLTENPMTIAELLSSAN